MQAQWQPGAAEGDLLPNLLAMGPWSPSCYIGNEQYMPWLPTDAMWGGAAWPPTCADQFGGPRSAWQAPAPAATARPAAHPPRPSGKRRGHKSLEVRSQAAAQAAATAAGSPRSETAADAEAGALDAAEERRARDDEDVALMMKIEAARSCHEVLQAARDAREALGPESAVAVLHRLARCSPVDGPCGPSVADLPDFGLLLRHLRRLLPQIRHPRSLSRLAWALGRLQVHTPDTEAAISHVCEAAPAALQEFTPQDLTNTLWALARLQRGGCGGMEHDGGHASSKRGSVATPPSRTRAAEAIVAACAERAELLTAQCLSNALWGCARLRLGGPAAGRFVQRCLEELGGKRQLQVFTPQGLANILWALAELGVHEAPAGTAGSRLPTTVWEVCGAVAADARQRLEGFQPQELSMLAWAYAKLYGRSAADGRKNRRAGAGGRGRRPTEVDNLLLEVANEAAHRLPSFSAQSVSNIAWALATLELLSEGQRCLPARGFMQQALLTAMDQLETYSPQAISNLLWAAARADPPGAVTELSQTVRVFASAAAQVATLRMLEFSFRDLSGVVVAFAHGHWLLPEVVTFATLLAGHAATHCTELTPRMMLNIAQSVVRLRVAPVAMQGMVDAIAKCMASGSSYFNEVDERQWKEVQGWCAPRPQAWL